MDVHRSRFVPFPTSAISALAFSKSSDNGHAGPLPALKLAIGRANGDVEIWNPQKGDWVQETVFLGDGRSIDGVLWTQDAHETNSEGNVHIGQQRLFSIASSATVTEWDLGLGQVKRQSTGNFSEVWCFAAQPRAKSQKDQQDTAHAQEIVAGCGDGTLLLLSTAEDDLQFRRFLARVSGKKARCMCITYQNRDRVVAGFADSAIRIYDTRNASLLRSMSLGVGIPGAPKTTLVWQVKCLPNGDIVSADSNGEVRFWDGKTSSLSQRIAGHDTDCLDLVTSSDGKTVFSGSIDGKIAIYRQSNDGGRLSWAKSSHRRVHQGETKAMAAFDSKGMSVLVSGGSDVSPVVTPLREYGKENIRYLPTLPQQPPVVSAPKARLLVSWWEKSISIWRIAKQTHIDAVPEPHSPKKLVARINLTTKHNVRTVAISSNGKVITAGTDSEVKVFQLQRKVGRDPLAIRKLDVPTDLASSGARLLSFSRDSKWLAAVTPDCEVYMARLTQHPDKPKQMQILPKIVELDRQSRQSPKQSAFQDYDRTITCAAFSEHGNVFITGDLSGYLDSWALKGNEDPSAPAVGKARKDLQAGRSDSESDDSSDSDSSDDDDDDSDTAFYEQYWTDNPTGNLLPKLDSAPIIMTFRPDRPVKGEQLDADPAPQTSHQLLIITAKHQIYEFDVLAGGLTNWSRRNPSAALPVEFTKIRDRVKDALWDVSGGHERLWLYGGSFVCMLNVGADLPQQTEKQADRKRRKGKDGPNNEMQRKQRKLESGAGAKLKSTRGTGPIGSVTLYDDGEAKELNGQREAESLADDDEASDDESVDLPVARRNEDDSMDAAQGSHVGGRKWWCTFKYRPILGMVAVEDEETDGADRPFEVVIVERPMDPHKEQR